MESPHSDSVTTFPSWRMRSGASALLKRNVYAENKSAYVKKS